MEELSSLIWCIGILLFLSSVKGQLKDGQSVESCTFQEDTYYQGTTINDPSTLTTVNSTVCCLYCQCNEDCRAWSWNKLSGACFLKDDTISSIANCNYTSGIHNNILDAANPITSSLCLKELGGLSVQSSVSVPEDESNMEPEGAALAVAVPAKAESEAASCTKQSNTKYPGTARLSAYRASSASDCCEDCRDNLRCFSWYFRSYKKLCVLNADVPAPQSISGYTGGSFF